MAEEWPPKGYSPPREYISSDGWVLGIALVLLLPVLAFIRPDVSVGASLFAEWTILAGEEIGLVRYPLLFVFVAFIAGICWIFASGAIIITLHECIHYALGAVLDVNPRFEFHTQLLMPNPSVVAYSQGISRGENIVMLSGPLVGLSLVCISVMWMTTGLVAATAAIMFAINVLPSCGDLYHIGRIVLMPRGTLFANFDEDEGLRTEVVTPESVSNAV